MALSTETQGFLTEADEHLDEAQRLMKKTAVAIGFDKLTEPARERITRVLERKHGNVTYLREDLKRIPTIATGEVSEGGS